MKKTELFLVVVIVALGGGMWILNRETAETAAQAPPPQKNPAIPETEVRLTPIVFTQSVSTATANATNDPPQSADPAQAQNQPLSSTGNESLRDPVAREALAMVGIDPFAEQYWLGAIFDTSLPDNERADLMEDLNETGFDDPKNVTADDLPLIISRLEIIDAVLPQADDFMTQHLIEAQKDLSNMLTKASQ